VEVRELDRNANNIRPARIVEIRELDMNTNNIRAAKILYVRGPDGLQVSLN